jgi:hypothetical protein
MCRQGQEGGDASQGQTTRPSCSATRSSSA